MHGGGLVVGKADMNAHYVRYLIEALGIVIVSVDYRLAPEAPFPQPLDDCYTALQRVHANAHTFGIDASRVAVGGESAGGGLAASLVQLTQDRGEMMPAFQLLVYPMLDDHSGLRTTLEEHEWLVWTPRNNRFGWESYLGQACGSENVPPYAVPARRQDVTNFPPTWIGNGFNLAAFFGGNSHKKPWGGSAPEDDCIVELNGHGCRPTQVPIFYDTLSRNRHAFCHVLKHTTM